MLYHVADVDAGLGEIARVLRPEGQLVAVTNSEDHLGEARAVGGIDMRGKSPFSRENAEPQLRRRFAAVERHDVNGTVTFAGHAEVRRYVESMGIVRGSPADVPVFEGPLQATRRVSIFVARR
jgi:SAM-dependent methyltransferase